MNDTKHLKIYNLVLRGWLNGVVTEQQIDLLVRVKNLTKEQGEQIKKIRVGDKNLSEELSSNLIEDSSQQI